MAEKPKWVDEFEQKAELVFIIAKSFDSNVSDANFRKLVKDYAVKLDQMPKLEMPSVSTEPQTNTVGDPFEHQKPE